MYEIDCPHCKGTGLIETTYQLSGEKVTVCCAICNGTKTVEVED